MVTNKGHGQDPCSCATRVLFDVSHNPVSDVNIGQNVKSFACLFSVGLLS